MLDAGVTKLANDIGREKLWLECCAMALQAG